MTIRLVPEARRELRDAADFYEQQQPGLGRRLWQEQTASAVCHCQPGGQSPTGCQPASRIVTRP
jgi:hypothetical protein